MKRTLFGLMCMTAVGTASGGTWYVNGNVMLLGNGKSPLTPFKRIQEGIDAAAEGDTVIVAEGTYCENIEFKGQNIVLTSTNPGDTSVRDATIIAASQVDNVVRFHGGEDKTCVLTGFTIKNGRSDDWAGGVDGQETLATIENNLIWANEGKFGGGISRCAGLIQNNVIFSNSAVHGGGVCSCDGTIQNNTIRQNLAAAFGGGLAYCDGAIRSNLIIANSAWLGTMGCGGGLSSCEATVENNAITHNNARLNGGGLHWCNGTIQNNTISENYAWAFGGGLADCYGAIRSNLIVGNSASFDNIGYGGGLSSCGGRVENNTIVQNDAIVSGGGLYECRGLIRNCVIWENTASSDPQLSGQSSPTYCCIQAWTGGGEGNTSLNPIFADADGPDNDPSTFDDNDYRLQPYMDASVCIDKGKNEDWMKQATDLDGNVRIFHGLTSATVDMGAYEYDSFPFRVQRFDRTPTGEPRIRWTSRPGERYVVWSRPVLHSTGPIHVIWEEEVSIMALAGSTMWTDYAPSGRRKFYRVEVRP